MLQDLFQWSQTFSVIHLLLRCSLIQSNYSTTACRFVYSVSSPQHIPRCSLHPREECCLARDQSVFKSAPGLHIPSNPLSHKSFNSSFVKGTDASSLFPFPRFFSCFCLDWKTFLVFSKTKSLIMLRSWLVLNAIIGADGNDKLAIVFIQLNGWNISSLPVFV